MSNRWTRLIVSLFLMILGVYVGASSGWHFAVPMFTAGAGYWAREFTPPGKTIETPEQQEARYKFYDSIKNECLVGLFFILVFLLLVILILNSAGVFSIGN